MDTDDLEPRPTLKVPPNLENMSVEALRDYVAQLKAEIARAEAQIDAKQSHRQAADKLFKS